MINQKFGLNFILMGIENGTKHIQENRIKKSTGVTKTLSNKKKGSSTHTISIKEIDVDLNLNLNSLVLDFNKIINTGEDKKIEFNRDVRGIKRKIELKQKKFKNGRSKKRSKFNYIVIKIRPWSLFISSAVIYCFFCFIGLFGFNLKGLMNEQGIHSIITNPKFIIDSINSNRYFGLFLSLGFAVIPLSTPYIFQNNLHKGKINLNKMVMGDLSFALVLDFVSAFKIIDHVFCNKNNREVGSTIIL